jgi:phenol 2-monooxygenase
MPSESIKHSKTDLLIIGAGPAGLMAANFAAACGLRNVRIIDKRNDKVGAADCHEDTAQSSPYVLYLCRSLPVKVNESCCDACLEISLTAASLTADGLQCRTLETFQSFGMGQDIIRAANEMTEICFWNPVDGKLSRTGRIPDTIPNISRFRQVVLHQGRIERLFLNNIQRLSEGAIKIERGVLPETLDLDEHKVEDPSDDNYPIKITVRQLSVSVCICLCEHQSDTYTSDMKEEEATPSQLGKAAPNGLFRSPLSPDDTPDSLAQNVAAGSREVIHAKYVIGCDGAHSWTRKQIGGKMEGEQTDFIWGVLDAIPVTDFPDIRKRCAIHSEKSGSVMIIPREDGLVRLYIQLSETHKDVDRNTITWQMILASAQKIMSPFKMEISEKDLNWWTAYVIGQRICHTFSDKGDRVFIAGDACHTHSPKAGQGMNVSMMDTFNFTWKVAAVIKGQSPRSILKTYQAERRRVAIDLINFDHKFSRLFSGRPAADVADEAGISLDEFKVAFEKGNEFASGTAVDYGASLISAKKGSIEDEGDGTHLEPPGALSKEDLSSSKAGRWQIVVGKRFNTAQVINQSDAKPVELVDTMPSDGRWRIVFFCGDIKDPSQKQKIDALAEQMGKLQAHYTPKGANVDSVIDIITVGTAPRTETELTDYPPDLRPHTTRWHQLHSGGEGKRALSQDYWKVSLTEIEGCSWILIFPLSGLHRRRILPLWSRTSIQEVWYFAVWLYCSNSTRRIHCPSCRIGRHGSSKCFLLKRTTARYSTSHHRNDCTGKR